MVDQDCCLGSDCRFRCYSFVAAAISLSSIADAVDRFTTVVAAIDPEFRIWNMKIMMN